MSYLEEWERQVWPSAVKRFSLNAKFLRFSIPVHKGKRFRRALLRSML